MAEVIIELDGKEHTIQVGSETILEAALKAGIDAPFSCRSAICSTCMAQIVEGEVKMDQNHVLTDEELEEGFIVSCQSHPTTDRIKITYDY